MNFFYNGGTIADIGIESETVKQSKTIHQLDMKSDVKDLSVQWELKDSDEEDQLYLEKMKIDNGHVGNDFEDKNCSVEWLKLYPNIHVIERRHWT